MNAKLGFLALDDVDVRVREAHARWAWHAGLGLYVYALSCTRSRAVCQNFEGHASVGGRLEAAFALTGYRRVGPFVPFAAVSGTGIAARGLIASERRLLGRLGGYARFGDSLLSVYVLSSLGNDLGAIRRRTLNVVGAGVSFAR
jgi:hypothetical protein